MHALKVTELGDHGDRRREQLAQQRQLRVKYPVPDLVLGLGTKTPGRPIRAGAKSADQEPGDGERYQRERELLDAE